MARYSDYKIVPCTIMSNLKVKEKFKITSGNQTVSIHSTYESAATLVDKLVLDPWFLDRGYTKADRNKN